MREKVIQAVNLFIDNDIKLLESSAHEQAISHRIGVYLESLFESEKLNIDCEYNKHLDEPKKIDLYNLNPKLCENCKCNSCRFVIKGNLNEIPERGFGQIFWFMSVGQMDLILLQSKLRKIKSVHSMRLSLKL